MDPRDARIFERAFGKVAELKHLLGSQKSYYIRSQTLTELQDCYAVVIFFDPIHSIERRFEHDLWNTCFREPISQCLEALTKHSKEPKAVVQLQNRLSAVIDRGYGCYSIMINKLLERMSGKNLSDSAIEASMAFNLPPPGLTSSVGGHLDLDNQTLLSQYTRFNSDAHIALEDTARIIARVEASQFKPTILPRGARLPDSLSKNMLSAACKKPAESLPNLTLSQAVIYLIQHSLIHLGDLARYQRQQSIAKCCYTSSWLFDPASGHPYNQLGVVETSGSRYRMDTLCAFYVCALASRYPFMIAKTNLENSFKSHRTTTKEAFSVYLQDLSLEPDLSALLLSPMDLFLRVHATAANQFDTWGAVVAAEEFEFAVRALKSVINNVAGSENIPKCLAKRAQDLAKDYAKVTSLKTSAPTIKRLEGRLLNTVLIHSYGLYTNWGTDGTSTLVRKSLVYTTATLIEWFCVVAEAVRGKPGSGETPIVPLVLAALMLKMHTSSQLTEQLECPELSDKECQEFASPLSQSTVNLLNSLSKQINLSEEELSGVNLPELFTLQEFRLMDIPDFASTYMPGPYVDLVPKSFYDADASLRDIYFQKRVSILIEAFRSVAQKLPSILNWSDAEEAFVRVSREAPTLPKPPTMAVSPPHVQTLAPEKPPFSSFTHTPSDLSRAPATTTAASNGGRRGKDEINKQELSRFMQEEAAKVLLRQAEKEKESIAKMGFRNGSESGINRTFAPRYSQMYGNAAGNSGGAAANWNNTGLVNYSDQYANPYHSNGFVNHGQGYQATTNGAMANPYVNPNLNYMGSAQLPAYMPMNVVRHFPMYRVPTPRHNPPLIPPNQWASSGQATFMDVSGPQHALSNGNYQPGSNKENGGEKFPNSTYI